MQSHSSYTFFFKHLFLFIAGFIFITGLVNYFLPDHVSMNEEPAGFDFFNYLLRGLICVLSLVLHLLFSPHFVQVKLGGQNITLLDAKEQKINWLEVESLTKFWLIAPPLYKLKIKNKEGYYLFVSQPSYIETPVGSVDMSSMGSIIKRKKRELGILSWM